MPGKLVYHTLKNIFRKTPSNGETNQAQQKENEKIGSSLDGNISKVKKMLGNSADPVIRVIQIGSENNVNVGVLYTDGMVNTTALQNLIDSIINNMKQDDLEQLDTNIVTVVRKKALNVGEIQQIEDYNTLVTNIISGHAALLFDNESQAITVSIPGHEKRSVEEPQSATLIKGPRDGFTETLSMNTSLLRRRIRNSDLWLESKEIGRVTKTKVMIAYIKGIANEDVIKEVHQRLDKINIDAILETGYVEELIQDETYTPFPTIFSTERPDTVDGKLLEGRVAILVDGSPFALIVPS